MNLSESFNEFNIKSENTQDKIFCLVRQKYYVLTPEEWVRQNWIKYLISELKYPRNSMVLEKSINWNGLSKRADLVIYKKQKPYLLFEFKAMTIKLKPTYIDQLYKYNKILDAKIIALSNGCSHYLVEKKETTFKQINVIPSYF